MKQIKKSLLSVLLVVLVVCLGMLVYFNYSEYTKRVKAQEEANATPPPPTVQPTPTQSPTPEPEALVNATLGVFGDIVVHSGINDEAKQADGSYNFVTVFSGAAEAASAADYSICTMETSFAQRDSYTGYPMFVSPPELAASMKEVGFDLVNMASNHSMDGYKNGLDRTLDILDQNGLDHVGTYRSQEERDTNQGIVVKEINGITIAFLSYTYSTNGIPVTGFEYAVNLLFNDYMTSFNDINYDLLKSDMAAARALNTDLIAVIPHWGNEYERQPIAYQKELADFFFKEGADLILGGHVHVPEPIELRRVTDNEGNEKTGLIAYCLGNLISCQNDRYTNLTAGLKIDLEKNLEKGETYIKHVSYTPMFMVDLLDHNISADWRYRLINLGTAIADFESGNNQGYITQDLYGKLQAGLTDLHSIMDPAFDIGNGGVNALAWTEENR